MTIKKATKFVWWSVGLVQFNGHLNKKECSPFELKPGLAVPWAFGVVEQKPKTCFIFGND